MRNKMKLKDGSPPPETVELRPETSTRKRATGTSWKKETGNIGINNIIVGCEGESTFPRTIDKRTGLFCTNEKERKLYEGGKKQELCH